MLPPVFEDEANVFGPLVTRHVGVLGTLRHRGCHVVVPVIHVLLSVDFH